MYESLLTAEEAVRSIDMGDFYRVPSDKRDLNYSKYFDKGQAPSELIEEYNSDNTEQLTVDELAEKLVALDYIQAELAKWEASL